MTAEADDSPHPHPRALRWPFPHARRIGSTVYVGSQIADDMPEHDRDRIGPQTHGAFRRLVSQLESCGARMADLVKLHTYYLYDGTGEDVTRFWEQMTGVRLQYLADPGPAATALRVRGLRDSRALIGVDGIGDVRTPKTRIMPAHAWDWSIPTPFSQGWLVGDKVYVGGQISADRKGRAIAAGELIPQVRNTLDYIEHVLRDAGSTWSDVVSLKIAYQCGDDQAMGRQTLTGIVGEVKRRVPVASPVLVSLGVDLLYEGLLLEIDATAVKHAEKRFVSTPGADFPSAARVGDEVYVGGVGAADGASLSAQIGSTMERIGQLLRQCGAGLDDLVKLNVYYVAEGRDNGGDVTGLVDVLERHLDRDRTVVSIVRVAGLTQPGQRVQVDGIAIVGDT
ncbi:Rid family hydrolase [Paraburkholderia sp.]|uniref:Rid family hydrolase n=1 Tax=Paraburkholderia sp. TaxID=1926495 RepID=UPI0039E4923E